MGAVCCPPPSPPPMVMVHLPCGVGVWLRADFRIICFPYILKPLWSEWSQLRNDLRIGHLRFILRIICFRMLFRIIEIIMVLKPSSSESFIFCIFY